MKSLLSLIALVTALGCASAQAQYTDGIIKIGVMNDMSGTYKDLSGQGSVIAARRRSTWNGSVRSAARTSSCARRKAACASSSACFLVSNSRWSLSASAAGNVAASRSMRSAALRLG